MDSIYFSEIVSLPDVEWVSTFGFSCGGRYLAMRSVKSRDNRLTIYDLDSGDLVKNISIQRFISSIVWHPTDETVLAVGVSPWELIILDIMGSSVHISIASSRSVELCSAADEAWSISYESCSIPDMAFSQSVAGLQGQTLLAVLVERDVYVSIQSQSDKLQWMPFKRLHLPGMTQNSPKHIPQRIQFIPGTYQVIVEYPGEGATCLRVQYWEGTDIATHVWQYRPPLGSFVVCAHAVSDEQQIFAVSAIRHYWTGITVHVCCRGSILREVSFNMTQWPTRPAQLVAPKGPVFLADGTALLCATEGGDIYLLSGWSGCVVRAMQRKVTDDIADSNQWMVVRMVHRETGSRILVGMYMLGTSHTDTVPRQRVVAWSSNEL